MLIRIKPLHDSMEKEVFIPQDRITAIRRINPDWGDAIEYQIVVSGYAYTIDKNTYERIVNEFMVLDTETGTLKWDFFDDKDVKQNAQEG